MLKQTITSLCLLVGMNLSAQENLLEGFDYGRQEAPQGNEWQSPERLSLGKEQPQAYMFHFATAEQARQVMPTASTYYQTLDGQWKFHWVPSPDKRPADCFKADYDVTSWDNIEVPGCWNVQGLQTDGTMKYGVPIYVNQPVIFYHQVAVDDWKKGVMRVPSDTRYTTYKYPNEVGSYRRTFTVPAEWKGRHVFINFDGVDSFFYLWINGRYVGFSKNSRNTARFDITDLLTEGENMVAVEVYRNSDASFLEAQDMFRLPGIIRSTYRTSVPETEIRDLAVRTASIAGRQATLTVDAEVRNLGKKDLKDHTMAYTVYPVELYGDATSDAVKEATAALDKVMKGTTLGNHSEFQMEQPRLWSAEAPYRYVLVAELKDKKGRVLDRTSTYFGVRTVQIRQTAAQDDEFGLAGRYFYVNDKPVKLKGVNRHETNPSRGHAITHAQMQEEVFLMKRGNINHVRLSHYANDPYWYYLTDKYGLYLEDEANIESHEYYYGEASLSHPKEWRNAHIARNMEMVRAHVNAPSIVIWSLGNEAGPGDNFVAAYQAIKDYDTSRPVQYERNNDIVDMGSNQYPSVSWVQEVAKGKAGVKYPYHISEYAHSMGNSLGNLVDYWEAMESTNFFCGAAIWDWVDQAIDTYTPQGVKYLGYGGDHGDWPNDGMFCMNGIMLPDLTPKPQYYEVKKVYQNVGVKLAGDNTTVEIFNKNYFEPLACDVVYRVSQEGQVMEEGTLPGVKGLAPRSARKVQIPTQIFARSGWEQVTIEVDFLLPQDMPWAKKGYVQMAEQFEFRQGAAKSPYKPIAQVATNGGELTVEQTPEAIRVTGGNGFKVAFDNADGSIRAYMADGHALIEDGNGPKLDAFRAPVDNDNWAWNQWFQNGLYDLRHTTQEAPVVIREKDGSVSIVYTVRSQATHHGQAVHRPGKAGEPIIEIKQGKEMGEDEFHFTTTQRYTVYPDGSINLVSSIVSSDASLPLPRLGYVMKLPRQYNQYTYYGRGPLNNYADRKTGSFFGRYSSTVEQQFVNFAKPQSMGNREEVSWCALTDKQGDGLAFVADYERRMSTSALPWSALQMTLASHPHELPQSDGNYLHLDCQVTGLGGNSCGQGGPLGKDRVRGALHQMGFVIRPVSKDNLAERVRVQTSNLCPVTIVRDRAGVLSILGDQNDKSGRQICYTVQPTGSKKAGKPQMVTAGQELRLREGGVVTAWYEGEESVKTTATFGRIENVPVEVAYVSSEEGPGGEVAKNLVDGNPATIWHTMYSITVPKYPHWVDFDCGEAKTIKGFTYLPRQDSRNGHIKGYKVQLSMDGKNWGDTVCQGEFENNAKEKKVTFDKPQKARYLRFTALSSQDGQDFASGAEFTVLAE